MKLCFSPITLRNFVELETRTSFFQQTHRVWSGCTTATPATLCFFLCFVRLAGVLVSF